jgi:hypothetical protein
MENEGCGTGSISDEQKKTLIEKTLDEINATKKLKIGYMEEGKK